MLEYFVGKPCTITTVAINWRFNSEPMMDYFMGVVEKIDVKGILVTHPQTGCKNYIFLKHIVSISEEQVFYDNNPEHKKIIEEYKEKNPEKAAKTMIPAEKSVVKAVPLPPVPKYVDFNKLTALAKKPK